MTALTITAAIAAYIVTALPLAILVGRFLRGNEPLESIHPIRIDQRFEDQPRHDDAELARSLCEGRTVNHFHKGAVQHD